MGRRTINQGGANAALTIKQVLAMKDKQRKEALAKMARHQPRSKTYLNLGLRDWASNLTPDKLNLSDDFKIEYRGEGNGWCQVSIKDPNEQLPRWYEIRVVERI